jgi:hypothetical protein
MCVVWVERAGGELILAVGTNVKVVIYNISLDRYGKWAPSAGCRSGGFLILSVLHAVASW